MSDQVETSTPEHAGPISRAALPILAAHSTPP